MTFLLLQRLLAYCSWIGYSINGLDYTKMQPACQIQADILYYVKFS